MTQYTIKPGDKLHFIGIGGIGMSALAQLFSYVGCDVSGSDRAAANPENHEIFDALQAQNIKIFDQDGSFIKNCSPDYLIYSTAIENDNADFAAAPDIPRLHRSEALRNALSLMLPRQSIAVTGSCGKTTVTAWLSEALANLQQEPACLNGGLVNAFRRPGNAGNFEPGDGNYFVFEADESDKSLLAYQADYALILNIGTDHYSREELIEVFSQFAAGIRKGMVLEQEIYDLLKDKIPTGLQVRTFSSNNPCADFFRDQCADNTSTVNEMLVNLPVPGSHNADNAAAILACLNLLGFDGETAVKAVESFHGVWRRFEIAGNMPGGAAVYDDYAHNPEKIVSCIKTAQSICKGRVFAVFQPHGFGPLKFMRQSLLEQLTQCLRDKDSFFMLPPYYAGGTSSFEPTSKEVIAGYKEQKPQYNFKFFADRNQLKTALQNASGQDDIVLILGARDNSLSLYASSLCHPA